MKKYFAILFMICAGFTVISCGHDDPVDPNEITRVQDGNGKVFIEDGILIDANLDYTENELKEALSKYNWIREYGFFYDNHHVSSKSDDIKSYTLPDSIYTNGTLRVTNERPSASFRDYVVEGKKLIATMQEDITSSHFDFPRTYVIVAFSMNENGRLMIMEDVKTGYVFKDYLPSSTKIRMVWRALPASE